MVWDECDEIHKSRKYWAVYKNLVEAKAEANGREIADFYSCKRLAETKVSFLHYRFDLYGPLSHSLPAWV